MTLIHPDHVFSWDGNLKSMYAEAFHTLQRIACEQVWAEELITTIQVAAENEAFPHELGLAVWRALDDYEERKLDDPQHRVPQD